MATDPRTIIDSNQDPGLSPQPNNTLTSNVADYDTREKKTVIIDYTDPPLYGTPELQIFNDPGGSNGQVQFNKGNRFGGDNNLVWNAKIRTLSVLGNIRVSGEILGRLTTNITKLKITGGNIGDVLTTDGLGNISWTDINLNYGNTNVANYLPTYTGNLSGSNLTISNTAYIYNISSTGLTSLTTANVSGNLTANAIYTNNYFYANGSPFVTSNYANSNVANYLPTYTGNVSANYFIGNGSQLTGLPTQYANSNVANYLPTYTGNVSANYFIGNGSMLTGISGGNANTGDFSFSGNTMSVTEDGTIRAYRNAGYQPNVTIELDSAELFPILYSFTSQGLVFPDETTQNTAYTGYQAPVTVSDNAPNSAIEGNIWFNSQAGRSYVKYNDQWVDMNPTTLSPDPANPFDQDLNTTDNVTFNKVSTTNINSNSNIFLSANNNEWKFGDDGSLTFPSNITIGYEGIQASANTVLGILTQGSNGAASLQWVDDFEDPTSVSAVVVNSPFANTGAVQIVTGNFDEMSPNNLEHSWTFDANGNLTFPDSTVQTTAYTGQQNSEILISNVAPNANVEGRLWFNSVDGRTYVTYNSQWVDSSPAVMDASALRTDQDNNLELPNNAIFLDGRVYQDAANGTTSQRWVNMTPSEGPLEMLRAYRDGFSNGDEEDERGQIGLVYQSNNVSGLYITSFDNNNENTWTFEGTGNLRFPDDTIQTTAYQPATLLDGGGANANYVSNIAPGGIANPFDQELNTYDNVQFANVTATYFIGNGSMLTGISGGNANTGNVTFNDINVIGDGNLNLQPDNSVSSAYLDIYLTTGPDIHIASNSENLILGRDSGPNVLVGIDGNVSIRANSGTGYTWTFDSDGNLTVPGNSKINWGTNKGSITYTGSPSNITGTLAISTGTGTSVNRNITLTTGYFNDASYTWDFSPTGNLTLPGNTFSVNYANGTQVSIGGSYSNADVANYLPTYTGNVSANYFIGNGSQLTGLPASYANSNVAAYLPTYTGNVSANYFIGNGATLTYITGSNVSGNVTSAIQSHYANIANSVAGSNVSGQVGNALVAGTVYTNAQPNITSLGTLANLTVSGTSVTGVNSILAGPTFTPLANTMSGFVSNVNSYTQLTIQNKSTGADATTDFVATADNGTDTVNYLDLGIINSGYDNLTPTNSLGNIVYAADSYIYAQGNASATSQSGGNLAIGTTVASKTVKIFAGGANANSIIATVSNTGLAVTGNVTATNFSGNISITGNVTGTSANVTLVAGIYSTIFDNTGVATFPGNVSISGNFLGNGAALSGVAVRTTGTWTVTTGTNTYSITVPINGNYQLWVRGNIPNGIIAYQATVSVTNTNVPVLGSQRAWNYTGGGSPILLTTMPTQIVGAEGTISTTVVSTATANRFDFVINNSSGSSQTVSWGYVTL